MSKGFTLVEVIIVMAILVILVGLSSTSLVSFGKKANQDNGQAVLIDALSQARNNSMANLSANPWGVHLQSDRAVIFMGAVYDPTNANKHNQTKLLPTSVGLSWSLALGGGDILFDQNQSTVPNYGDITLTSSANKTTVVKINSEGLIE